MSRDPTTFELGAAVFAIWLACLAMLVGCMALMSGCVPVKQEAATRPITSACVRSFVPTLEAWEARLGRVPQRCAYLDREYDVIVSDAIPCGPALPNGLLLVGCTRAQHRAIYVLAGRSPVQQLDTSVHEWVHALAACVTGNADDDHARTELWEGYGADAVEPQGIAAAQVGECTSGEGVKAPVLERDSDEI